MFDDISQILTLMEEKEPILLTIARNKLTFKSVIERRKEAEDILQEVRLDVLRRQEHYTGLENPYLTITRKVEAKANARNQRAKRHLDKFDSVVSAMLETCEKGNPHEELEKRELHENIAKCGESLGTLYKDIFFLRLLNGWDFREISQLQNLSETTVKKRYYRAYQKVIKCLEHIYGARNI